MTSSSGDGAGLVVNSTVTCFARSLRLPCLMALMTDSRTATSIHVSASSSKRSPRPIWSLTSCTMSSISKALEKCSRTVVSGSGISVLTERVIGERSVILHTIDQNTADAIVQTCLPASHAPSDPPAVSGAPSACRATSRSRTGPSCWARSRPGAPRSAGSRQAETAGPRWPAWRRSASRSPLSPGADGAGLARRRPRPWRARGARRAARCRKLRDHGALPDGRAGRARVCRDADRRRLAQPTADAARGGAAGADGRARRHGRRLPARDGAGRAAARNRCTQMPVPSAQVKSAVLLAGLHAEGVTTVAEPAETRDHTERALTAFGADISVERGRVSVRGRRALTAADVAVPGDPSSAAFWAAAAAGIPGAAVVIEGVSVNPTRTAFLAVIARMGRRRRRGERRRGRRRGAGHRDGAARDAQGRSRSIPRRSPASSTSSPPWPRWPRTAAG